MIKPNLLQLPGGGWSINTDRNHLPTKHGKPIALWPCEQIAIAVICPLLLEVERVEASTADFYFG